MKNKNLYKKWRFIRPAIIAGFVAVAGIAAVVTSSAEADQSGDIVIIRDTENDRDSVGTGKNAETQPADTGKAAEDSLTTTGETTVGPEENLPVVYICGEVQNPGLYKCSPESRIADVVELAGGLKPEADDTCVNMAARVTDAQQIVITKKGEAPAATAANGTAAGSNGGDTFTQGNGPVNINTADEAQLKTLPGIGEQKAKAIVSYRQEGGSFGCIEDIMKVPGIKDGAFAKIKNLITV